MLLFLVWFTQLNNYIVRSYRDVNTCYFSCTGLPCLYSVYICYFPGSGLHNIDMCYIPWSGLHNVDICVTTLVWFTQCRYVLLSWV